jgi:hypothetical protein
VMVQRCLPTSTEWNEMIIAHKDDSKASTALHEVQFLIECWCWIHIFIARMTSLAYLPTLLTLEWASNSKYWPRTSHFDFLQPISNYLHVKAREDTSVLRKKLIKNLQCCGRGPSKGQIIKPS